MFHTGILGNKVLSNQQILEVTARKSSLGRPKALNPRLVRHLVISLNGLSIIILILGTPSKVRSILGKPRIYALVPVLQTPMP